MWIRCCLILHNMIIDIEEELGLLASADTYNTEAQGWGESLVNGNQSEALENDDEYVGLPGQIFRNRVKDMLLRSCVL